MTIQPVNIWVNGVDMQAVDFIMKSVFDNLSDMATFYYQLFDVNGVQLADGNLTMVDPEYDIWGQSGDINLAAYQWGATQLNLTLL